MYNEIYPELIKYEKCRDVAEDPEKGPARRRLRGPPSVAVLSLTFATRFHASDLRTPTEATLPAGASIILLRVYAT